MFRQYLDTILLNEKRVLLKNKTKQVKVRYGLGLGLGIIPAL